MNLHAMMERVTRSGATKCRRKFVRAVLFDELGWTRPEAINGPEGDHVCTGKVGACGCRHAEDRLFERVNADLAGWTIGITHAPCMTCAKLIRGRKIDRVIYAHEAPHHSLALTWLESQGVTVMRVAP